MTESPEINPANVEIDEEVPEPGSNDYYKWLQAKQFDERSAEQKKSKVSRPKKRKNPAEQYPSLYSSRMMPITKNGENRNRSKR